MSMLSRTAAAFIAVMTMSGAALAQVDEQAKQVIQEMKAAMQGATDVSFKAKRTATGLLKDFINLEGEVKIVREADKPAQARTQLKARMPGSPDKVVDLWTDGVNAIWNDNTSNRQFTRPVKDPLAVSEINMTKQIMVEEWTEPRAFEKELNATSLAIEGVEQVRGKVCDKVVAKQNGRTTIWYVDSVDRLPLKREDVAEGGADKPSLTIITEMWDYQTGVGTKASAIAMTLPAGFVEDKPLAPPPMEMPVAVDPGPKAGEPAPEFELTNAKGEQVTLAQLKGNVAVLCFFGTWNAPSMRAMTEVQNLSEEYKGKNAAVKVFGLACSEPSVENAKKAVEENKLTFDVLYDCETVATQYLVQGVPSYCIVDKSGNVAKFFQSYPGRQKLAEAIDAALAK